MAFLDSIRLKFHRLALQKELKKQKQIERCSIPFHEAKNIGILFQEEQEEVVKRYAHQLRSQQGKSVVPLGFYAPVSSKETPEYPFDTYTIKDWNWKYIPRSKEVKSFIDEPFDILINFMKEKHIHSHYIMVLSKAKFRIGANSTNINAYDLILDEKIDDPERMIELMEQYLQIFNTKPNGAK